MTVSSRRTTPALLQIDSILTRLVGAQAVGEVCRFLRAEFDHYSWVGVYRLSGETLELVGWDGAQPTEHTRIPIDRGLCGQAARENRTVLAGDVSAHPEYLACFADTRSEIVVPVRGPEGVVGEIDIDGTRAGAYDASDQRFLEEVARKLVAPLTSAEPARIV